MQPSEERRPAAIAFILLTIFIDILGIGIVIPVIPKLVQEFVGPDQKEIARFVGAISAAYALMQFFFAPVMGVLSDRFGRRPILLLSLFGLGVDFLIQGFSTNIGWLFVGRLLAGMMGASITTANAYIADISTPDNRARNFGLVGMMFGFGFIFGPALGGMLGEIHVRIPFFLASGLALLNWLYGYFILPESLPPEQRGTLAFGRANPLRALERLTDYPVVAQLSLAWACMSLAQRGLENVWVLSSSFRFGWDTVTNGMTLALVGVMAAIVQGGIVRPVISRLGEQRAVLMGLTIQTIAFLGYGLATEGWMIPCIIVLGAFGGLTGPAMQSILTGNVKPVDQGKLQGALTSIVSLTNILAPLGFNSLLYSWACRPPVFLPGAPFLAGAVLLIFAQSVAASVFRRIDQGR